MSMSWANSSKDLLTPKLVKQEKAIRDAGVKREMVSEHQLHFEQMISEIQRIIDEKGKFSMNEVDASIGNTTYDRGNIIHDLRNIPIFSTKAQKTLKRKNAASMDKLVEDIVNHSFSSKGANDFRNEIRDLFMLCRGGTITGQINNYIGRFFTSKVINLLKGILDSESITYDTVTGSSIASGEYIKSLKWSVVNSSKEEVKCMLLLDRNISWVTTPDDKNYDMIFLNSHDEDSLTDPKSVVAVVELKGGSDNAGADEHFSTAKAKLQRIKDAEATIPLGAIVCAVDSTVASDMWSSVPSLLKFVANGEKDDHVEGLLKAVLKEFD